MGNGKVETSLVIGDVGHTLNDLGVGGISKGIAKRLALNWENMARRDGAELTDMLGSLDV